MADEIEIPTLWSEYLFKLSVCSRVSTRNQSVLNHIKKLGSEGMTALVDKGRTVYAELFGGGQIKNHVHINVAHRWADWKEIKPVPISKVQIALAKLSGLQVKSFVTAEFICSMEDLPKSGFVRSSFGNRKKSATGVGLKSQTISVLDKKSSLREFGWTLMGGELIRIRMLFRIAAKVQPKYLLRLEEYVDAAFNHIIMEKNPHDRLTK